MRVIEQALIGKFGDPERCEDAIVVTPGFVAVIDGTTDRTGWTLGGKLGGRVAAERVAKAIASLSPDVDVRQAIEAATGAVASIDYDGPDDQPSAAMTVYSVHRRELWVVGDVTYWFEGLPNRPPAKAVDVALADMRAAVLQTYLAEGADPEVLRMDDPGVEAIRPLLLRQYLLRNLDRPWGYGAIDGSPVPDGLFSVVPLGADIAELVLTSDGYPVVLPSLAASEAELARLLAADPLCIGELRGPKGVPPGAQSFDDRAYVRIEL